MLIIKAYIYDGTSNKQIDEIHIQNISHWSKDKYMYKVQKPDIERRFFHNRSKGWKDLAKQVIQHLISMEITEEGAKEKR
jgi:hypothetical protein